MSRREEGFLSRWSRRKRGELPEPEAPPPAVVPEVEVAVEVGPEPAAAAAEFDPASLPPVESLTGASDFTAFLRPGVPAPLRQAALRRAWTLDPAIRDFIGPADYAWDYNAPDGVPGFTLQLGGDVTRLLAQAIGALEDLAVPEETPAAPEPPVALLAGQPVEPGPEVVPAVVAPTGIATAAIAPGQDAAPPATPPPRRHGRAMPV